jgi:hypothetical protein
MIRLFLRTVVARNYFFGRKFRSLDKDPKEAKFSPAFNEETAKNLRPKIGAN